MQTNANWRLVEGTANSSLGSPYYHPRSQDGSLDTLSLSLPSLCGTSVVHLLSLLESLSSPLSCVLPPPLPSG